VKQLLQHKTPDFITPDLITPDLWLPNSPDLNTVYYRMCGVLQKCVYRKCVKIERWWTEAASDSSVVWHPGKRRWSGKLTNGEFTLMHVSKPKESILKTYYVVLFHNCGNLLWNLHSVIFCFTTFNQSWLLKF